MIIESDPLFMNLDAIFIGRKHPTLTYGMTGMAIRWSDGTYAFWGHGHNPRHHNNRITCYLLRSELKFCDPKRTE